MTKVLFVCIANFCRSPVAEKIFNKISKKSIIAESSGTEDFFSYEMDPRSQKYLLKHDISDIEHTPRKITPKMIFEFDKIYALDYKVFLSLKNNYKAQNVKMINTFDQSISLYDPYSLENLDEYNNCLDNIKKCVEIIAERSLSDDS